MSTLPELRHPLILGTYAAEIIRPSFTASVEGKSAVVRLDGTAMFKLAEDAEDDALAYFLNLHRGRIRDAAQRLFEQGQYREQGADLEIWVTASDID